MSVYETAESEVLEVIGAKVHNLKNIDVRIPRNQFVVITGLSGSGKSSLAFDTIYAEGQRRYIESFSAYARQFLGNMERPDVDKITGLSPVISIEQKTVNKNPRSTVGTITEIYDFLRLLFARASDAFSYETGEKMIRYSDDQIINLILEKYQSKKITVLAPLVKGRKGHYRELFEKIRKQGFLRARVNGEVIELIQRVQLDRYKTHDIEIVIDRLEVNATEQDRIRAAIQLAMKHGKGSIMILENDSDEVKHFSRHLMCPTSGISYDEPAPNLFSFNSPYGACPRCNGLGQVSEIATDKIIPNQKLSIKQGGILAIGEYKNNWIFNQLEAIGNKYGFELSTPIHELSEEAINTILFGSDEIFKVKTHRDSAATNYAISFEGIANFMIRQQEEKNTPSLKKWVDGFMNKVNCEACEGTRLKKEALHFKINDKNIAELSNEQCNQLRKFVENGGSLLATFETSLYNEEGDRRSDFELADLFGASYANGVEGPMKNSYLRLKSEPSGQFHPVLNGLHDAFRSINSIYSVNVKAKMDLPSPVTVIPSYPDLPMEHVYPRETNPQVRGLYLNEKGRGRVAYFPGDIDRTFWQIMNADHGKLLQNTIHWALNEAPVVDVTGPGVMDVTVWQQEDSMTIHLVNLTNPMMMKGPFREFIPVDAKIEIQVPETQKVTDVHLLIKEETPGFKTEGNKIILDVSNIADYEIIGIDLS